MSANIATTGNNARESAYNEGKGIKMTIVFTPLSSLDPSKKRRANAKPTSITKINNFFHEELSFPDALNEIFLVLDRVDLLEDSQLFQGEDLDNEDRDSFILTYTVPRRVSTAVRINDAKDFGEMLDEATHKDEASVKFFVVEQALAGENDDKGEQSDSDDEEGQRARKKKKTGPSAEEVEQNRVIRELEQKYHCEDRSCRKTPCYVTGPKAFHVHLTFQHLRFWAAGIQAKVDGVTQDKPPNDKLFDPPARHDDEDDASDTDDIAVLAKRRADKNRKKAEAEAAAAAAKAAPTTQVNFVGLAEMVRELSRGRSSSPLGATATAAPAAPAAVPVLAVATTNPAPLPPMEPDAFALFYRLKAPLVEKLATIDFAGPHTLGGMSDEALRKEANLSLGELTALRYAESCWVYDSTKK